MNKYQEVTPENTPANAIPYRKVNQPFRFQFVIPGKGVKIEEDRNGICYISADGISMDELQAGDNISIDRTEGGKVVISAVNTATDIAAGQNITIDIDPNTGTATISSIIGGPTNEHYKGVFDTPEDLIEAVTEPEVGDYGMIKNIVITNGESTWNGQYKYCFYINGQWTVVDQMLTFTKDLDLLQQFYSVGGSSPVIYLHEVARSGNFWALNNIPIVATPVVTVNGMTVTATCETDGAEIWYTTDGTMPHVNGTKYTGPITAAGATDFRFVAIKNGMINSLEASASADYSLKAPAIELDWHDGTVTMYNSNEDGNGDPVGTIYYTTDGTTPTNASTAYTGPFLLTIPDTDPRELTVRAVVYDADNTAYSAVTASTFYKAGTNGSTGSGAGNGTISEYWWATKGISNSQATGGEVHYTLDGGTPDYSSTKLDAALTFPRYGGPATLKVKGFCPGCVPSTVRTRTIGYEKPTAPVISFDADTNEVTLSATGNVTATPSVPMQTNNDNPNFGYRIYYTTDGSTPTAATGTIYTGPFQISGNTTVKAVIVAYGQYYSDVTTDSIVITNLPVISLNSNTGEISISGPEGAILHYTTNGSEPTAESPVYSSPITVLETDASITVKAIAVDGGSVSGTATATYTRPMTSAYLDFAPNNTTGNVYAAIHRPTGTGLITYTENGNLPTYQDTEFPAQYLTLQRFMANPPVLTLREFKEGYLPAFVRVYDTSLYGIYAATDAPSITYDEDTDIVTMALTGNTVDIPLQTNNNVPTMGARIYYTMDGSTPTAQNGMIYQDKPVPVQEGTTEIKAVTICYGEFASEVTTEDLSPEPSGNYMYFEAVEPNSTVALTSMLETAPNLEYSTDGETWQEWQHTTSEGVHTFDTLTLTAVGDRVYLRGANPAGFLDIENEAISLFSMTGKIAAGGNAQSLVDGATPTLVAKTMPLFLDMFITGEPSDVLTQAPALPATTLTEFCYANMFRGCTSLTTAPALPATTLTEHCYQGMFDDCTSLTQAPALPATTLAEYCYANMFKECSSLTTAPALPATTLAEHCYDEMFYGCTGLTQAPALPATTLAEYCYENMFDGCTGLTQAPALPATTLAEYCYYEMFYGCEFDMSDDGTTFNFQCDATLPQTVDEETFTTPEELAEWMGNTNGFTNP